MSWQVEIGCGSDQFLHGGQDGFLLTGTERSQTGSGPHLIQNRNEILHKRVAYNKHPFDINETKLPLLAFSSASVWAHCPLPS